MADMEIKKEKPKRTERQKCMLMLRIESMIMMVFVLALIPLCISLLISTVFEMVEVFAGPINFSSFAIDGFEMFGDLFATFTAIRNVLKVFDFIGIFLFTAIVIVLLVLMRKQINKYKESDDISENVVEVKKTPYTLWGFFFGAYGAHYFYSGNKKRGYIMLALGLVGTFVIVQPPILLIYTMGVSFADAYLACFLDKNRHNLIEIEEYPFWI